MESVRLKAKATIYKHCTIVEKVVSLGVQVTILKLLCIYMKIEQINKWTADNGNPVSHCGCKRLQIARGGG